MAQKIGKAGIVGGGVIGAGWAARFALNGIDVSVYDPDPEIERKTAAVLANARRAMTRLFGQAIGRAGSKVHRNRMRNTRSNLTNHIPKRRHNIAVYMAAGQA